MTDLAIFLALALLLLGLLLLWLRSSQARAPDPFKARVALTVLQLAVPPRALAERIFALEDWDFISNQTPRQVQRLFLTERRQVALAWLRETRRKVEEVMELHGRAVRRTSSLHPFAELRLATSYAFFLSVYGFLFSLIWLHGPFVARRMVGFTVDIAEGLSFLTARLLVQLEPTDFPEAYAGGTRG